MRRPRSRSARSAGGLPREDVIGERPDRLLARWTDERFERLHVDASPSIDVERELLDLLRRRAEGHAGALDEQARGRAIHLRAGRAALRDHPVGRLVLLHRRELVHDPALLDGLVRAAPLVDAAAIAAPVGHREDERVR